MLKSYHFFFLNQHVNESFYHTYEQAACHLAWSEGVGTFQLSLMTHGIFQTSREVVFAANVEDSYIRKNCGKSNRYSSLENPFSTKWIIYLQLIA